jgi:hypothetical protein
MSWNSSSDFFTVSFDLDANLCLVTLGADQFWSSMVRWVVAATVYAEANNVGSNDSNQLPLARLGCGLKAFFSVPLGQSATTRRSTSEI